MANDKGGEIESFQREIEDAVQHYKELIDEKGEASTAPRNLIRIEGQQVTDFSSQYGSENSFSYVASNLAGKTSVFPSYGDFINACVFRTYGPWWSIAPSGMRRYHGTPSSFVSVDFIELSFATCLYPVNVEVYETYNSGSIVRICACDRQDGTNVDVGKIRWVTLWEGSPQPYMKPRIFSPPLKTVDFATNLIRIELNHDRQDYYTELDGVRLVGSKTPPAATNDEQTRGNVKDAGGSVTDALQAKTGLVDLEEITDELSKLSTSSNGEDASECYFTFLPEEIIQILLSYLDTRDLCRLSQTCRFLRDQCYDPLLYADLNLQPYWSEVSMSKFKAIEYILVRERRSYKRESLGRVPLVLHVHHRDFGNGILHIFDAHGSFRYFADLYQPKGVFREIPLKNLRRLNLYRTKIDEESLTSVFRTSTDLEHLNIGSCAKLNTSINHVLKELGQNCRKLKTIDLWRMKNLTAEGFDYLYNNCTLLEEIDLGWCTAMKSDSDCFVRLAAVCKNLKKLYLTANRTVNDKDVRAVTDGCPSLEQLDILGMREVSKATILRLLEQCKNMKMLDVSFCVGISFADVLSWRSMFPAVSIKKSFQNISEL